MNYSDAVLGTSITKSLRARATAPLLTIGKDVFDRAMLSHVECFNFQAAANLSAILNHELQVKDTKDVFEHIAPNDLVLPRLGAVSLAVLGAAFELMGLGGKTPLDSWVKYHKQTVVTFSTLKIRAQHAERKQKRERRLRVVRRQKAG